MIGGKLAPFAYLNRSRLPIVTHHLPIAKRCLHLVHTECAFVINWFEADSYVLCEIRPKKAIVA